MTPFVVSSWKRFKRFATCPSSLTTTSVRTSKNISSSWYCSNESITLRHIPAAPNRSLFSGLSMAIFITASSPAYITSRSAPYRSTRSASNSHAPLPPSSSPAPSPLPSRFWPRALSHDKDINASAADKAVEGSSIYRCIAFKQAAAALASQSWSCVSLFESDRA